MGRLLPSEGFCIVHPTALGTEDLLYNVAHAALPACIVADVCAECADFGGGIGGAARTPAMAHYFIIGYVIAHVDDFFGLKAVFLEPLLEDRELEAHAVVDVGQAETFVALAHGRALAACDDGHGIAEAGGVVKGVTVFDVGRALGLAVIGEQDDVAAQYAIDVEAEGAYFREVVVYHLISLLGRR